MMSTARETGHVCLLLAFFAFASASGAATIWDEAADGDLSNDPFDPTTVHLVGPSDRLIGTVGGTPPGEFYDVFTFRVPSGATLTKITLVDYVPTVGNATTDFTLWAGASGEDPDPGEALLIRSFGVGDIGNSLIAPVGTLSTGHYSISVRELVPGQAYDFRFVLSQPTIVAWDEAVDGDLSNEPGIPTVVSMAPSVTNVVRGTVGGSDPGEFWDVWTFNVPMGSQLATIRLDHYVPDGGTLNSRFTVWPGANGDLLDFGLAVATMSIGLPEIGTDLIRGHESLGPGDYSISIRESTPFQEYELVFLLDENGALFLDGFESGDTSSWSSVTP